jgi:hypothetical protein
MADWQNKQAEAVSIWGGTGTLINLVRIPDGRGGTVWHDAHAPRGAGPPSSPQGDLALTPDELLDALRGPLGVAV